MSIQQQPPPPQTNIFIDMALGGVASACAALVSNPPELIKTRLQLQRELKKDGRLVYSSMFDCANKIIKYEGYTGLQNGLSAAISYQLVMNSIRLGLFDYVNNLDAFHHINADQPVLNAIKNFTIASTCGAFGAWLGSPIFVVKTRLQVQNNARLTHPDIVIGEQYGYSGLIDGLRKIESTGGLKGLYKNSTISSQRVFFGSGVQLTSYDQMKYLFSTYCGLNGTPLALCSSAVSSFLVTIAMNPLDLVLSRVNNQNINNPKYFSALDCFQKVFKHEGFSAFYKGFWAHYLRLAPHGITTFVCLEQFKLMFKGVSKREASLRQRTAQKD